jgi:hypothetical protein
MPSAATRIVPAPNIRPCGVNIIAELAKAARSRASDPSRGCSCRTCLLRRLLLNEKIAVRDAPRVRFGIQLSRKGTRSITLKAIGSPIVAGPEEANRPRRHIPSADDVRRGLFRITVWNSDRNLKGARIIARPAAGSGADADRKIRSELLDRLGHQDWTDFGQRNVIVNSGIVHLWGLVGSREEHKALVALAEGVPGVVSVSDEMIPAYWLRIAAIIARW